MPSIEYASEYLHNTMVKINSNYSDSAEIVLYNGDCLDLLKQIPDDAAKLVVTSPPYNIGKPYEDILPLEEYLEQQEKVIAECARILHLHGSLCWQVGYYSENGEIFPLDIALYNFFKRQDLKLKNRIIWHFRGGQHAFKKFSPRYETVMWFTKGSDYIFDVDPVRVPRRWPTNIRKSGPQEGQLYGSPLGKNPGDVWIINKVSHGHPEKTKHPCQYPVALIERLMLSLTNPGDLVVDPYIGSGTTAVAAVLHGRRCAGSDKKQEYIGIAKNRVLEAANGTLKYLPLSRFSSIDSRKAA